MTSRHIALRFQMGFLKHLAVDITPLKVSRDYRLLFFGQLISLFGSMMTIVVIPWQMYELTQSNAMVGFIYLAEFIPMVILAFVGGAMADAFDKRRLLRLTELGQVVTTLILLINSMLPTPMYWVLFLGAALHAGFAAIQRPAFESYIQKILPSEHMAAVIALNSMRWSFGAIISFVISGYIAATFSPTTVYLIDLVTFAATLVALFLVSAVPTAANAARPSWQTIKEGWQYAFRRQDLMGTYLMDICAMFFAMPQALYPALGAVYGKEYVGFFFAAIAVGALLGGLTSGWTKLVHRHGLMVTIAAGLWGVAIIFFGLSSSLWVALFFLMIGGYFDMISGIFRGAIWNQTIPNQFRGRLASIEMMSYLTGPMLGNAKMGIVAEAFSVKFAIISGGVFCIVGIIILALFLPKFIAYDGREGRKQRELEEEKLEQGLSIV